MAALKRVEARLPVPEICRELGISRATFYTWRAKFGGRDTWKMARMKKLEDDNCLLKKMYFEEKLKAEIAKEVVQLRVSTIRVACGVFSVSESCCRYESKQNAHNEEIAN